MDVWSKTTLKSLLTPGGWLLLAAVALLHTGFIQIPLPVISYFFYCALAIGLLLAWRFHASRIFLILLLLFLSHRALAFFSLGHVPVTGPGRAAFQAISVLLPLDIALLALGQDRGFTWTSLSPVAVLLFVESVAVALVCRPAPARLASHALHPAVAPSLSVLSLVFFVLAMVILLGRFLLFRKPAHSALLWVLSSSMLAFQFGAVGRIPTAYFAVSALILAVSIIETSYSLAYQDELTSLPSRRAFNDAQLRLSAPYSIAMVDIDHFKRVNDTYGHDIGDQVLRMVAAKLARVSGAGQAFRCGGEEFAILFSGKTTKEVLSHLEDLRVAIGSAELRMRGADRRLEARGPDRRNQNSRGRAKGQAIRDLAHPDGSVLLAVTVSIGVACSDEKLSHVEQVIQAADKALYRAKAGGRNRVETSVAPRARTRAKATRSIA